MTAPFSQATAEPRTCLWCGATFAPWRDAQRSCGRKACVDAMRKADAKAQRKLWREMKAQAQPDDARAEREASA